MCHHLVRFLCALFCVSLLAPAATPQSPAPELLLILDASGSMWGRVEGEEKIVIARRVLKDLASKLADGSEVGLIAYDHRREGDCADIETVVPVGRLNRTRLASKVEGLNPKGKTPITQSIEQAIAAVEGRPDRIVVAPVRLEGRPKRESELDVAAGESREWVADFAQ